MASTKELERTLPRICPNPRDDHANINPQAKHTVYTLVSLTPAQLSQLEDDLNSAEVSNGECKIAPKPDFSGRSLRDIYDHHLEIRDTDSTIQPLHFIVVDQADWNAKGVLFVNLARIDRRELDRVGVGRCGVDMADCWAANFEIGNQDWMDLKEEEEADWGGEDPYGESSDPEYDFGDGVVRGLFGWYSLIQKAGPFHNFLEPGWSDRHPSMNRLQTLGNYTRLTEPWDEIRTMHPRQCLNRPQVHRQLIAVAERPDPEQEDAVAIVELEWDGKVEGLDDEYSQVIKPPVTVLKKVPAGEALSALKEAAGGPWLASDTKWDE